MSEAKALVADIGGTNARFALYGSGGRERLEVLACADYPDLAAAVEDFIGRVGLSGAAGLGAAFAVACPTDNDQIRLTNNHWSFSVAATAARLGLARLQVINDFTALALALPQLDPGQRRQLGGGEPRPGPLALLGPGTGLGVSGLLASPAGWLPLTGEGGHVTLAAADAADAELIAVVRRNHPHVSAERLLSGPGLVNLYAALAELDGRPLRGTPPTPADILSRGLAGEGLYRQTLDRFCALLGTVAGNLALTLGAAGGVYLGGGIIPRMGEYFDRSPFRQRFEQRGRFSVYLGRLPCYVISDPYAALDGAARLFDPLYRDLGVRHVAGPDSA